MRVRRTRWAGVFLAMLVAGPPHAALASSHREAPFITESPKVDSTDVYLFRSYEPGREDYVTLIANYQPFQDPYGGPNYFSLDPEALYEIHVDNNGDAKEDLTFRFRFDNDLANNGQGLAVPAGDQQTAVPLINIGPITVNDNSNLNVIESYTLQLVKGDRRFGKVSDITSAADGNNVFTKPTDYIGTKTFGPPDVYEAYAQSFNYEVTIPGCGATGRVFAGQRAESFAVNLGVIFDLLNAPPEVIVGGNTPQGRDLVPSIIAGDNITTLALEVPIACLKGSSDVIGAWTSSSLRQVRILNPRATFELPAFEGGAWTQISRLATPLVNELVIGLPDKNLFNGSQPKDDAQFLNYVTNPSLPELIEILFGSAGVVAPNRFPRDDLVAVFLTGVPGVNANGATGEMLRLNTAIPPTPKGMQNSLGALNCFVFGELVLENPGCDPAGLPNGRRPGDDAVDIALRVVMGFLLPLADAPSGQLGFTDAALQEDSQFNNVFPYLVTPTPGAGGSGS